MNRMDRRTFIKAAGGVAAGSFFFGACGEAPGFNRGVKKTLNFWAFSDTRIIWQKFAFDLYKKERNPDFEITWSIFPYNQMHDQLLVTSQAGTGGPDIADVEISQFSRFIKGDNVVFVDLAPALKQRGVMNSFYQASATNPWSWQGHVYGIGNELNTVLLSYRWDVWEKAKVKTPIDTWDEFVEEAKRFHQDTGNYLIDFPFDDWASWWIMTQQQHRGFFNAQGQPILNDPINVQVLKFQQQAIKDGWSTVRPPSAAAQSYYAQLNSGTVASLIGPSWNFSGGIQENVPQSKGKWHLQALPAWPTPDGSRTATHGGTGVSVLKTGQSPDEALDFVLYEHTNVEALLHDFSERQVWPTYMPAFEDSRLSAPLEFFDNQQVGEVIKDLSPHINQWYNSPYWSETTNACMTFGITPAIQNKGASVQQVLDTAQSQTQSIINFETA